MVSYRSRYLQLLGEEKEKENSAFNHQHRKRTHLQTQQQEEGRTHCRKKQILSLSKANNAEETPMLAKRAKTGLLIPPSKQAMVKKVLVKEIPITLQGKVAASKRDVPAHRDIRSMAKRQLFKGSGPTITSNHDGPSRNTRPHATVHTMTSNHVKLVSKESFHEKIKRFYNAMVSPPHLKETMTPNVVSTTKEMSHGGEQVENLNQESALETQEVEPDQISSRTAVTDSFNTASDHHRSSHLLPQEATITFSCIDTTTAVEFEMPLNMDVLEDLPPGHSIECNISGNSMELNPLPAAASGNVVKELDVGVQSSAARIASGDFSNNNNNDTSGCEQAACVPRPANVILITADDESPSRPAEQGDHDIVEIPLQDNADADSASEQPACTTAPVSRRRKERATNTRRRTRNPSMWIKNISKQCCNAGLEHLSRNGKVMPARQMGSGCGATCRFRCHDRVTRGDRTKIFDKFWGTESKHLQWHMIKDLTEVTTPRERSKKFGAKEKKLSRMYFFTTTEGKKEKVCQTMFLSTLNISEKVVRTATSKYVNSGLMISPDKRGTHKKHNQEQLDKLRATCDEHIRKYKAVPSHFCRKDSKRKYLEPGLSTAKMFREYKEWMEQNNPKEPRASERIYHDYFCEKFNYGFHMPRKDQCDFCNIYIRSKPKQKAELKAKFKEHIKRKDLARDLKNLDKAAAKKDPKICFAIFDLEKVLVCPKDDSSTMYYQRKLSTYNFTVFNVITREGRCYVWHEGEGKRGANEMASCLEDFISYMCQQRHVADFRLWSDNCSGQNKNRFLFALYSHLSQKFGVKITHRYLEKGHTQNEADTMHSCIERASRRKNIFEPEEWYKIIKAAKSSDKPYEVIRMNGRFKNLHTLAEKYQQWSGHRGVNWKLVREIVLYPEESGKVSVRHDLSEDSDPIMLNVTLKGRGRPVNLSTYQLPGAYKGALQLKAAKINDLATLCFSGIIPSDYVKFYITLRGFKQAYKKLGGVIPTGEEDESEGEIAIDYPGETLEGCDEPDTDHEDWYAQNKDLE